MNYQEIVDGFVLTTCILSIEKLPDGGYGNIRIVAGNKPYIDSIENPANGASAHMLNNKFIPDSPYEKYIPKDLNFEQAVYKSAILKTPIHTYLKPERFFCWLNQYILPIESDDPNKGYCSYSMQITMEANSEMMSNVSASASSAVLETCIKLRGSTDFKKTLHEIRRMDKYDLVIFTKGEILDQQNKIKRSGLEKYFDDPESITEAEIIAAIRKGTISMQCTPMLLGSSYKNKGVQPLLDYVCAFLPAPVDVEVIKGMNPNSEEEEDRKPSEDEPTSALAFKIATDPYMGRLVFFRVYSGKITAGSYVFNPRSGKKERISRLFQMNSNKEIPMESIDAGDIGAGVGFKDIRTGDTLCDENAPIVLGSMTFPDTVISIAVEPKSQADIAKLDNGLAKLAEEDPTFTVRTDEQSGQTIISGMGELHLDIIIDRLKREFKVECNQGKPQVNYKEAITKTVEIEETYKKQSGGRGKYAKMLVQVGPVDEDYDVKTNGGLQFVNEVKGGNIPKEFIPSIQKGFEAAMKNGILGGYPVDSLKVTVVDGGFHPVDSDQLSFEIAAQMAYKEACAKAKPVLMEPIMKLEVVTPEENMGDVIGDLNKRRGQVEGMEESRSGARVVKAMVPLSEMFGYVTALRTITSGRATSSMEYDHHAPLSSTIAKAVLEEVKGRADLV